MVDKQSTKREPTRREAGDGTKVSKKPKRRNKSDLGPNFIAPDGGWGWVVCIAAGFSNFSLLAPLQQYGLIFRKRMTSFGFDAKQTTTIVNVVMALSSGVGLVNGAMFRRFTFRQVGIMGSLLVFTGLFLSVFCETFSQYLMCFSSIYGIGLGLCTASSSLAVNTYFKNKRRKATGFAWTVTGLGPIIFPQVATLLLSHYGAQGTILVFSAISLNTLLSATTYQPVLRHSPKPPVEKVAEAKGNSTQNGDVSHQEQSDFECRYCQFQKKEKRGIFSSQYLFNEDDTEKPGYEIIEPATPMMIRANDGWYGSKSSLSEKLSPRYRSNRGLKQNSTSEMCENGYEQEQPQEGSLYKPNYFNREKEEFDRYASKVSVYSKTGGHAVHCTCAEERALLQSKSDEAKKEEEAKLRLQLENDEIIRSRMTVWQKVVQFFDLDLLKDFTFVNLAIGMTIMMFGEINFSVLTPFILNSFGYSDTQISLAMSLLAGMDIAVRFLAPFVLEKVKLPNQVLFAFGIIAISIGRFVVTLTDSYNVILAVFLLIGFGKGFRTIFSPLIIPSYVPLKRLPAASGLQLIFSAVVYLTFGQLLGITTDNFGYAATVHCINILSCMALFSWLLESIVRKTLNKKKPLTVS